MAKSAGRIGLVSVMVSILLASEGAPGQSGTPTPPSSTTEALLDWLKKWIGGGGPISQPGGGKPDGVARTCSLEGASRWNVDLPLRAGCVPGTYSAAAIPVRFAAVEGVKDYQVELLDASGAVIAAQDVTARPDGVVALSLAWLKAPVGDCFRAHEAFVRMTARDESGGCVVMSEPMSVLVQPEACMESFRARWHTEAVALCPGDEDPIRGELCRDILPAEELKDMFKDGYYGEAVRVGGTIDARTPGTTRVVDLLQSGLRPGNIREESCLGG